MNGDAQTVPREIRLDALEIPLHAGWSLDLRRKGCTSRCVPLEGLPDGWRGSSGEAAPIRWRRVARGSAVTLDEGAPLGWELVPPGPAPGAPLPVIVRGGDLFERNSRDGVPPRGEFLCVNHLGLVELEIRWGREARTVRFEVVSTKFGHARDFELMTEEIAAHCQQLLLEWNTPTAAPFASDPIVRRRTLLEQFLYLKSALSGGRLERWIEAIRTRPHDLLVREARWVPAMLARGGDFLGDGARFGRDWRDASAGPTPGEVLEVTRRADRDTPPNRFVRHALMDMARICAEVKREFPPAGGPAHASAAEMLERIEGVLGGASFRDLSPIGRIPLENQTLQKREGYRDILRVWLLKEQAAQLEWGGREDVFNGTTRNVATLYEYWLFFELLRILRSIRGMAGTGLEASGGVAGPLPAFCKSADGKRLRINLRRGEESLLALEHAPGGLEPLRIHFWFDRTYRPTGAGDVLGAGAYTRPFRPDYSLAIFPAPFCRGREPLDAERCAEADGEIAYLHFDAKYRVEKLDGLFGRGEQDLEAEEEAKVTNTYRRADLYKMHAYNDAIRRTVAAYVLYPGSEPPQSRHARYRKYHELLPGVGAFALSPGDGAEADRETVRRFLEDVLREQRDRFSQLARIRYWTHDTIQERPTGYGAGTALLEVAAEKPPRDTAVLIGFIREGEDARFYREHSVFYCHAIEFDRAGDRPGAAADLGDLDPFRAEFLVLQQGGVTEPWIARVLGVRLVTAAERAEEMGRAPEEMGAAYYYRFELNAIRDCARRDVRALVGRRPGRPLLRTLADLATCSSVASDSP